MQTEFDPDSAPAWQARLFKKSLSRRQRLQQLRRLMAPTEGKACLDVGGGNGILSWMLRRKGGVWISLDARDWAVAAMASLFGEDKVFGLDGALLPFEDHSFDTIVVTDHLERIRDDAGFLRECHRCLKPKGELLLQVPHLTSFSFLRGLRHLLGLRGETLGLVRPGYRLRDLYEITKDGFDIVESLTYGGFFLGMVEAFLERFSGVEALDRPSSASVAARPDPRELRRLAGACRAYAFAYPLQHLAVLFDDLFRFTRTQFLVVKARPRPWIERKSVKLRDGRSIAEATIRTRIGTATDPLSPLPGS